MNILITTGIFPPASGGPATYAPKLAEGLLEAGHDVTVVTLSDTKENDLDEEYDFEIIRIRRRSKAINYIRFFWSVLTEMRKTDVAYTLSFFSLGFLTSVAARAFQTPYVVRIGGDYLWEHFYLKGNNQPIPLRDFYKKGLHAKYPIRFRVIRSIVQNARKVVFNSDVQADIYQKTYNLKEESVKVIHNPTPTENFGVQRQGTNKEIVYAGRFVPMKNIETLLHAFAGTDLPEYTLVLIGGGPKKEKISNLIEKLDLHDQTEVIDNLPQKKLFERIKNVRFVVVPSWTDISPNFIFECKALGIPFLITEENYLPFRDEIPNMIDPRSKKDVGKKIKLLAQDEDAYRRHKKDIKRISFKWSWDDVIDSHIKLFEQIV